MNANLFLRFFQPGAAFEVGAPRLADAAEDDVAAAGRSTRHSHLLSRWLFLRGLGLIYFSAFFALLFQVKGLIGPDGILPAASYLPHVAHSLGFWRFWYAPTLLWFSASSSMLMFFCWVGLVASCCVVLNLWPRASLFSCFLCFLSFVSAAQDFSGYQSDGMLLEAGFLSLFLAPRGLSPGIAFAQPPAPATIFLLLWEWFRIYFESGVVKLQSGDPQWRHLTAMFEYYQNGPLPTWIGWYLQHLPHWFQTATAGLTLIMELVLVFLAFLPRPWRIACFFIVTAWQIGVILSANYAFLNYLVLILAIFLLDDKILTRFIPKSWQNTPPSPPSVDDRQFSRFIRQWNGISIALPVVLLSWVFYATTMPLLQMFWRELPLPPQPVTALEPFRIANQYGLFAVMTPHRYEIEFQGSTDGNTWIAYPFRYKPQDPSARPRIYAPYQPRFDWNLWFASLGSWQDNLIVPRTEELLLSNDRDVLNLFAANPFPSNPPTYIRAVLWQYWFSTPAQKRSSGIWWTRQFLGTYAPTLTRTPSGQVAITADASLNGPPS